MSEHEESAAVSATPPGVVPYMECHTGPRRVVTLVIEVGSVGLGVPGVARRIAPVVSLDGRQFPVYWGRVAFEAAADRATHLAVTLDDAFAAASVLLPPGPDVVLGYRANPSGAAELVQL